MVLMSHSLIILIESSSQPCALLILSLRISFNISVSSIAKSLNLLFDYTVISSFSHNESQLLE